MKKWQRDKKLEISTYTYIKILEKNMIRWKYEEKMKNITKRGLGDEKMMKWWKDDTHTQLNVDN